MRARYCAYALHNEAFLLVTWLPTSRPSRVRFDPDLRWTGLEILATSDGTAFHRRGTVEFVAHYEVRRAGRWVAGRMHELSQFVRTDQWFYVEGVVQGGVVGRRP